MYSGERHCPDDRHAHSMHASNANGASMRGAHATPQTCLFHAPAKQSIPHACTPCITERNWGCQLGLPHVTCEISAISE